jgi:hypothetical protein
MVLGINDQPVLMFSTVGTVCTVRYLIRKPSIKLVEAKGLRVLSLKIPCLDQQLLSVFKFLTLISSKKIKSFMPLDTKFILSRSSTDITLRSI